MEATKINIRFWLFKVQCYRNNNTKWNIKLTLAYLELFNQFNVKHLTYFDSEKQKKWETTTTKKKKKHFSYLHCSNVETLSCDNTLIFMYFTQNLLENWIF